MDPKIRCDVANKFDVIDDRERGYVIHQPISGVEIAIAMGYSYAHQIVDLLNGCETVHVLKARPTYQPFTEDSAVPAGRDAFFLVRPRGLHQRTGEIYKPSVVQLIDGQLFTCMDELKPITWSKNGDIYQGPTEDPYEANLEWMLLPE